MNKSLFLFLTLGTLTFFGCKEYPHTHPIPPQLPPSAETKIPPVNLDDTLPEIVELRQADACLVTVGFAKIEATDAESGTKSLANEKVITAFIGYNQLRQWRAGHQLYPTDDAGLSKYIVGNYVSTARAQKTETNYSFATRHGETIAVTEKDFNEALKQIKARNKTIYEVLFAGYKRVFILEEPISEQTLLASESLKRYFVTIAVNGISTAPDAAAYLNTLPGGYNVELEVTKEIHDLSDKWPPSKELWQFLHPAYFSEISGTIKAKNTKIDKSYRVVTLQNEAKIIVPRDAFK